MSENSPASMPEAIYLGNIELTGFRGFRDGTCVPFTRQDGTPAQWTVILGENGTGKTALLQAIVAMSPILSQTLPKTLLSNDELVGWKPKATESYDWMSWWLSNSPLNRRDQSLNPTFSMEFCASENGIESASPNFNLSGIQNGGGWSAKLDKTKSGGLLLRLDFNIKSTIPKGRFLENFHLFGYAASRLANSSHSKVERRSTGDSLFSHYDIIDSPERWLIELDHLMRLEDDPDLKRRATAAYESAKRCIIAVLPDIEDVEVKRVAGGRLGKADFEVRARFKCPFGWVFFEELGQGYQSMASWAVDLLQHLHLIYPDREKPETGAAVVLIDEFDLHLHPKWQLTLMDHLGSIFTNCQFIITAHSPLLVQAAGPKTNLVVLRRETDPDGTNWIVADSDPVRIRGWRLDQIVTSDLFGLSSARPAGYAELFEKRASLISKPKRSKAEDRELKNITRRLEKEAPPSISREASEILAELQAR